jgi:hypothetical protein
MSKQAAISNEEEAMSNLPAGRQGLGRAPTPHDAGQAHGDR